MTNNQLTDEQIAQLLGDACMVIGDRFATVDELSAAKAIRALAVELQERRKPLQDKDLQGVIDALEHPAGINAAGKQVVRHALVELQERRKADSEPVALQPELAKVIYHFRDWNEGFPVERFKADYVISWMLENYPPAQPAKDRDQVRREHAEWSQATFGNVGPVGPLKHLSKEALEAAAEPGDLSEWADMQFLLWDAQHRAGITDEQITQAMIEKLAVNKQRKWPAPKDGEPRLHIKEQPAPVVPVTDAMAYAFHHALTDSPLGDDDVEDIKAGLRAALLNVFDTQPAPVVQMVPEEPPEHRLPKGNSRDTTYRRGAIILGWKLCRAAMLNGGNS
ncbi:hypothetical protein NUKP16_46020 [Klebsiella quasipneumoniae]|nr:hypothetical protein NUKP16_46020 [Klebsiella quasipneumoniae]GKQ06060.1 hypothetical protein NUKP771_46390 [Klebsiella quasipneumoniae]